jgi:hypothetical protein
MAALVSARVTRHYSLLKIKQADITLCSLQYTKTHSAERTTVQYTIDGCIGSGSALWLVL